MGKQIYLSFLTLCMIWYQGTAFSPDDKKTDSLDLFVRKKRLIDLTPNANITKSLTEAPYLVQLLENHIYVGIGSILLSNLIITAANLVWGDPSHYAIRSAVAIERPEPLHRVVIIARNPNATRNSYKSDIALLAIVPPIKILPGSDNQEINLSPGIPSAGFDVFIFGWGPRVDNRPTWRRFLKRPLTKLESIQFLRPLQQIQVKTINSTLCSNLYHGNSGIPDDAICTYDELKRCDREDRGNPLVINGQLVGIKGWSPPGHNGPDVFTSIGHINNLMWIFRNMVVGYSEYGLYNTQRISENPPEQSESEKYRVRSPEIQQARSLEMQRMRMQQRASAQHSTT